MVRLILITELYSKVHNVYIIIVMGIPFFQLDTLFEFQLNAKMLVQ